MNNWSDKIIDYYSLMRNDWTLPQGIELLFPYSDQAVMGTVTSFYKKYFNDSQQRVLILGINPGRFGAGVTGIPFTDPVILKENCGIDNSFQKKHELSALFVLEMIETFGGLDAFYRHFFIQAVCPLGFTKDGINCNYYDDNDLYDCVFPHILNNLRSIVDMGCQRDVVFSLGKGKNYKALKDINRKYSIFKEVLPLPHPRWVMQYNRKKKAEHIRSIVTTLESVL